MIRMPLSVRVFENSFLKLIFAVVFGCILGITLASELRAQTALDTMKRKMTSLCADATTPDKAFLCLLQMEKYESLTGKDYSRFSSGMMDLARDLDSRFFCSNVIPDYDRDVERILKEFPGSKIIKFDCQSLVSAFTAASGYDLPFAKCPPTPINDATLLECLKIVYNFEARRAAYKKMLDLYYDDEIDQLIAKDPSAGAKKFTAWKAGRYKDLASGQHQKSEKDDLASTRKKEIERCKDASRDNPPRTAELLSLLRTTAGAGGRHSSELVREINCKSLMSAYVKLGILSPTDVEEIVVGPSCKAGRDSELPLTIEVEDAVKSLSGKLFCDKEIYTFVTRSGREFSEFIYKDGICSRQFLGMTLVNSRTAFPSYSCSITTAGKSECRGTLYHYCSSTDGARQSIDCIGQTFKASAQLDLAYDARDCRWNGVSLNVDKSTIKTFELR